MNGHIFNTINVLDLPNKKRTTIDYNAILRFNPPWYEAGRGQVSRYGSASSIHPGRSWLSPAASRCRPILPWPWKPRLGLYREGSLQTALLPSEQDASRAMPGPPTSGSAGCAIPWPQGLYTGLDEEPPGIGSLLRAAIAIPCETGKAGRASGSSQWDCRAGNSRPDSFIVMQGGRALKSRHAASAAIAARGPGCLRRRVRRRYKPPAKAPVPPVPGEALCPNRLPWPGSHDGRLACPAWPATEGTVLSAPAHASHPAQIRVRAVGRDRRPDPVDGKNQTGPRRVACWRARPDGKGAATACINMQALSLFHPDTRTTAAPATAVVAPLSHHDPAPIRARQG